METLNFRFEHGQRQLPATAQLSGVVSSGNLEVLIEAAPLNGACTIEIRTAARGFGKIWQAVLGDFQQRWMHIAETDPATGLDANPGGTADPNGRFMFEVRVVKDQWYLDAFVQSKAGSKALAFPEKLHPINQWYAVEQTYDGKTYRSYVNGVLEGEGDAAFTPHGAGHVMVGVRMNHVNYFKGSVALARFTDKALTPGDFLKPPAQ